MKDVYEHEFYWHYAVPKGVNYIFHRDENCVICNNDDFNNWSARFIIAGVDMEKLADAARECFNLQINAEVIIGHKMHFRMVTAYDENLKEESFNKMKLIESELVAPVDERKLLESNLQSLWHRKIILEKIGKQDAKEYIEIISAIKDHIALKAKLKGELQEYVPIGLADILKIPKVGNDGAGTDNSTSKE
jgi:hypothetical protein